MGGETPHAFQTQCYDRGYCNMSLSNFVTKVIMKILLMWNVRTLRNTFHE